MFGSHKTDLLLSDLLSVFFPRSSLQDKRGLVIRSVLKRPLVVLQWLSIRFPSVCFITLQPGNKAS